MSGEADSDTHCSRCIEHHCGSWFVAYDHDKTNHVHWQHVQMPRPHGLPGFAANHHAVYHQLNFGDSSPVWK